LTFNRTIPGKGPQIYEVRPPFQLQTVQKTCPALAVNVTTPDGPLISP